MFLLPVKRYPNNNTSKEEQPQCLWSASSAANVVDVKNTYRCTKEFTLGKSLTNVSTVASVLVMQGT